MYGHVITKISRMGRLPHFLRHGAKLARVSSAIKMIENNEPIRHCTLFFQPSLSRTGAMKCILRSMGKQNPIELRIYSSIFCLVSVLSLTSLVSSQLSYHVESLVDTRNAMLNFSDEDEGRSYLQCVLRRLFKFVAIITAGYFKFKGTGVDRMR